MTYLLMATETKIIEKSTAFISSTITKQEVVWHINLYSFFIS